MQTEFVKFRMFHMPCCGQQLCWVNPRLPNHCPECGKSVFTQLKFDQSLTLMSDDSAKLVFGGMKDLYDVARKVCHDHGLPWTDPRTGKTYNPPKKVKFEK